MNCREGDLAITRIPTCLDGKFVTVLSLAQEGDGDLFGHRVIGNDSWGGPTWWVDFHHPYSLNGKRGKKSLFYDKFLRPIRDTPGEDETLQWAPVPGERVTA